MATTTSSSAAVLASATLTLGGSDLGERVALATALRPCGGLHAPLNISQQTRSPRFRCCQENCDERIATMKKHAVWLLALAAVLVVGCANQKGPAEQAVAGAETALAAVRDNAQKYVPDRLQAVDAQPAAPQDNLAQGDHRAPPKGAPAVHTAHRAAKDAGGGQKG